MIKRFAIFILYLAIFMPLPSYSFDNLKISNNAAKEIEREMSGIKSDISDREKQIKMIQRSNNLSQSEKQVKIRRLKNEITSKEREAKRLKIQCRRALM